ncbi:EGF-like domain-containing protein [Caerostris extrusa]|uniref:EGF-like domain-containing protein n=1 Tax=Caerostris extrusa TaxID=172846 RepID=A0AAV4N9U7_CAEEX|nr:EGF-like domain-containing protein [Caerostris extrusa]
MQSKGRTATKRNKWDATLTSHVDVTALVEFVSLFENGELSATQIQIQKRTATSVDNVLVDFGTPCEVKEGDSCWYEREVGDTLTLTVNITSDLDDDTFDVTWRRMYDKYNKKRKVLIKIEPAKKPWNMVLGSANRELRIDPVTNTDMDPNGISAKVYTTASEEGKTKRMLIKELKFYIQIPLTDMGIIKSGDYLRINLKITYHFLNLASFFFDWYIEISQGKRKVLPSNFKVSTSGRTVQVTGLKQKQKGIIICIVYSPTGIAIAKRRFNMKGSKQRGEVHYVDPVVTVVTDYFLTFSAPQDFQPNCSIDLDCGEGAVCVLPQGHKASVKVDEKDHKGYCYCKPEYFGDGFKCTKIPRGYHRDKRIKKGISQKQRRHKKSPKMYNPPFTSFTANSEDVTTPIESLYAANLVKYEEADSYLVSSCGRYRGNGLFCWELFDYIKSMDQAPDTTPILK